MYKELFRIKDGEVVPLSSREATIREVRLIVMRDKGSPGDADGRKKSMAYKELGAAYWIADYRSPGRMQGYEGKDLVDDAIRNFGLPDNWLPDDVVSNLITKYADNVNGGVAAQTLSEIAATFNLMLATVNKIRGLLRTKLALPNVSESELKDTIALQGELLKLTADIPKKIKDIEMAKEMLKFTDDEHELGRGGIVITSGMRPH